MTKEYLEAFRGFKNGMITDNAICITKSYFENKFPIIEQALQRLEAIDNANPSEALKELKILYDEIHPIDNIGILNIHFNNIEQSLIKSQEQEKVLEIIFEKNVDVWQLKQCDFERYNFWIRVYWSDFRKELTEEEFEILKRCL